MIEQKMFVFQEFRTVFWKGRDSSNKGFFNFNLQFSKEDLPSFINQQIDKLRSGLNLPDLEAAIEPTLVVNQQAEDISLLISLNQQIIIHRGSRKAAKKEEESGGRTKLHCVRSNAGTVFTRCIEVDCEARLLHSYYWYVGEVCTKTKISKRPPTPHQVCRFSFGLYYC